jgi:hypothetical protein
MKMREMKPSVHIVGDSISIQYGPYLSRSIAPWADYSRKEGHPGGNLDIPMGANGGPSTHVLEYIRACLEVRRHWHILAINCGLHDLITELDGRSRVPIDLYEKNLQAVFVICPKIADHTIWITTTGFDENIHNSIAKDFKRHEAEHKKYDAVARGVCRRNNIPIADLCQFTFTLPGPLYCDHVHFNETVREAQGCFLAGYLKAFWTLKSSA